ncbi:hypothetical protein [Kocuria sp. KH4]
MDLLAALLMVDSNTGMSTCMSTLYITTQNTAIRRSRRVIEMSHRTSRWPNGRLVRGDMAAFRWRSYLIVTNANSASVDAGITVSVWEDLDYVDEETNASIRRVSGSHCYSGGPELTEEIAAAVRGVGAPSMTPGGGARRFPYRQEPYGRAWIPTDLGELVIDGKVNMTEERGPLLNLWRQYAGGRVLDVFIPQAWVRPLPRDESAWIDVYDILDE